MKVNGIAETFTTEQEQELHNNYLQDKASFLLQKIHTYNEVKDGKLNDLARGESLSLSSGQGIAPTGLFSVNTNTLSPIGAFTLHWVQEIPSANSEKQSNGVDISSTDKFCFGINNNTTELLFRYGAVDSVVSHGSADGDIIDITWTWDGISSTADVYCNAVKVGTTDMSTSIVTRDFIYLLATKSASGLTNHVSAITGSFVFFSKYSDESEILSHVNNKLATLYLDNNVLKSKYLPDFVLNSDKFAFFFAETTHKILNGNYYTADSTKPLASPRIVGEFDGVDSWVLQSDWSILGGVANCTSTGLDPLTRSIQMLDVPELANDAIVELDVLDGAVGRLGIFNGTSLITLSGGVGRKRVLIPAGATTLNILAHPTFDGFTGSIDNITVTPADAVKDFPILGMVNGVSVTNAKGLAKGLQKNNYLPSQYGDPIALSENNIVHNGTAYNYVLPTAKFANKSFELDAVLSVPLLDSNNGYLGYLDANNNKKRLSIESNTFTPNNSVSVEFGDVTASLQAVGESVVITVRYDHLKSSVELFVNAKSLSVQTYVNLEMPEYIFIGAIADRDGGVFKGSSDIMHSVVIGDLRQSIDRQSEVSILLNKALGLI